MKRCDVTELPVDQCAGACCRPDLSRPEPAEKVRVSVQFTARFNSPCDVCDERIREGEPMGWADPLVFGDGDVRVCKRHLP